MYFTKMGVGKFDFDGTKVGSVDKISETKVQRRA